ncbi:MAG: hypothetical protein NTV86_02215 [Planctomycetota bacterium]|nr:hypothetical protein [Planctomycetota bacterium]
MQSLTEMALAQSNAGVFTRAEVACWLGGSADRQFGLLKRALAAREVVRVHRGLYCLAREYLAPQVDPLVLAQRIYGPSYISLETALSCHGWIPEAVYAVTSVCLGRSRELDTPLGHFSFTRVPQQTMYEDVARVEKDGSFMLASPLKALADYVYAHKQDWASAGPVIQSLRVDRDLLANVETEAFDRLAANYTSRRVRRFLKGLRKDLRT